MSHSTFISSILLGTVSLCLAGCPSGGVAKKVRSEQPTLAPHKPSVAPEQCDTAKSYDSLIVDWDPEERGDLEVAMKEGVAVVAYDCNSIRLLPDCSMEGGYGFIGMTRKEKVVSMEDADEIKANLPMSGVKYVAKLGGEMQRGTSLNAAMVMIGKKNSNIKRAHQSDLEEECGEATHFVRSATLGAFVLATSSEAKVQAAASFFGDTGAEAQSGSKESVQNSDGSLGECQKATPDAKSAPPQCGAPLRLNLKPIKTSAAPQGAPETPEVELPPSCPPSFVLTDNGCEKPQADTPFQCNLGDSSECQKQCDKGHPGSCYVLGTMMRDGVGSKKDWKAAVALLSKACDANHDNACRAAGKMVAAGHGVEKNTKDAQAMLAKSCDSGNALGCVDLGQLLLSDNKLNSGDAQFVFRRACYGGEYEGCTWLGKMYQEGLGGLRAKAKIANTFFKKGCKSGSALACYSLGLNLRSGKGSKKDKSRASELFEQACQGGHEAACAEK